MDIPQEPQYTKYFLVSQIIDKGVWAIPQIWSDQFPVVAREIQEVQIPDLDKDELYWSGSTDVIISVKAANNVYREKEKIILWEK